MTTAACPRLQRRARGARARDPGAARQPPPRRPGPRATGRARSSRAARVEPTPPSIDASRSCGTSRGGSTASATRSPNSRPATSASRCARREPRSPWPHAASATTPAPSTGTSERRSPPPGALLYTLRQPIGVVGAIVPWNFPLVIASWKVAAALACGNAVLVKPAALTPLTALRLGEICAAAGVPDGCVQVLVGSGATVGRALLDHPAIAKISFTGSTEVGREVMERGAKHFKRLTLELGGKSANLIFADADLEVVGRRGRQLRVRERGPGLLRAHPRSWSSVAAYDEFVAALRERIEAIVARRSPRPGDRDGVADLRVPTRTGIGLHRGRGRRRGQASPVAGAAARAERLLPLAGVAHRRHSRDARDARGDLRPGRRPHTRSPTSARRSRSPTTASTGSRARSGRATRGRAARVARGARNRRRARSTRATRSTSRRRSAGSSRRASGASSEPRRSTRTRKRRRSIRRSDRQRRRL